MSKFCTTCGASLDDSATFCTTCGTPQPSAAPAAAAQPAAAGATPASNAAAGVKNAFGTVKENFKPKEIIQSMTLDNIKNIRKNPNKNTIIGLACCGFIFIVILIIVLALIFRSPYKSVLNKYFDAMEDCNAKKYISVTMTDFQKEYAEDHLSDKYDSLEEKYEDYLDDVKDSAEDEYGDKVRYSYTVKKAKSLSDSKLKDWRDKYLDWYDDLDKSDVKVSKGYEVKCKVTVKGKDDDDSRTVTFTILKVNGDWVIADQDYD